MAKIIIAGVQKTYPPFNTVALAGIDLKLPSKSFLSVIGPSGCGKTTLLRCLAGLEQIDAGRIVFDDREVNAVPPHLREAVMVFQNILLFPYLSVFENIAFGLRVRRLPNPTITTRVHEVLGQVQLSHLARKRPHQISGGEQQRIALARALIIRPKILLLDEPLANLDRHLWRDMAYLIRDLHNRHQITTILVTHNQEEALLLSDRIAVMFSGRIAQVDSGTDLYLRPRTLKIAEFFDTGNIHPAVKRGNTIITEHGTFRLSQTNGYTDRPDGAVLFCVRPEKIIHAARRSNTLRGTLVSSRFTGTQWRNRILVGDSHWETLSPECRPEGESVTLHLPPESIMLFKNERKK